MEGLRMKGKKLNYWKLGEWMDLVCLVLMLLIAAAGWVFCDIVFYRLWPITKETPFASAFCPDSAFVLGVWILTWGLDGEWKNLKWWLCYLGRLAIPATIYVVATSQTYLTRSESWWALALSVLIGLVAIGLALGCDEVMSRVRRRVFGDTVKIGKKWCRFYEIHL